MATRSMILEMLKTPQQVRQEQQERLQKQALGQAQLMIPRTSGTTALPGLLSQFAASQMARQGPALADVGRRAASAAGQFAQARGATPETARQIARLGIPAEEQRAARMQQAVMQSDTSTIDGLQATIEKLRKAGAPASVILQLSDRLAELKAEQGTAPSYAGVNITAENFMDVANQMIQNGDLDEGLRLMDLFTQDPGSLERDLNYIAQTYFPGQDLSDPSVRAKAMEMLINYKRQDPTVRPAFEAASEQLDTSYEGAMNARRSALTAERSLEILASGDVNVGTFANTRQGAEKFYEAVLRGMGIDVSGEETVARTEQLLANSRQLSAELLGSGIFGAGTGISERDLLEAQRISGSAADLTPEGMRRILQLNARMARAKVKAHNERVERFDPRFWESSPFRGKDAFIVDVPAASITAQATRIIENDAGVVLYEVDGQWVTADGTPWTGE